MLGGDASKAMRCGRFEGNEGAGSVVFKGTNIVMNSGSSLSIMYAWCCQALLNDRRSRSSDKSLVWVIINEGFLNTSHYRICRVIY